MFLDQWFQIKIETWTPEKRKSVKIVIVVIIIMDWNLKIPCWEFTELEQGRIPNMDLKLGQVIDSGNSKGSSSVSKMVVSPSGSSKRARPVNNSISGGNCLVDGCIADLSNCKEYHRRHKVCQIHSKTPQVSINGQLQRFCQQCSRYVFYGWSHICVLLLMVCLLEIELGLFWALSLKLELGSWVIFLVQALLGLGSFIIC